MNNKQIIALYFYGWITVSIISVLSHFMFEEPQSLAAALFFVWAPVVCFVAAMLGAVVVLMAIIAFKVMPVLYKAIKNYYKAKHNHF